MTQKLKQGAIWLANLNPGRGSEPGKTRSVLIIQNQALLDIEHPSTLILPLTTNLMDNAEPLRLRIKAQEKLEKDSDVVIDQLRAIDNKRLKVGPLLTCDKGFMQNVYQALIDVLGANPFIKNLYP